MHPVCKVLLLFHVCYSEMLVGYENGTTPNPDVLCNKHIKFGAFYNYVIKNMDVDALATGHYAQNSYGNFLQQRHNGNARLLTATDLWKCQTLFLSQMSQEALRNTMFPVGDLLKKNVKKIASEIGLDRIVKKKESHGICFIGTRKFRDFIDEYVVPKPGVFIDAITGKVVGQHKGTHYWTRGQSARLNPVSYYVSSLDHLTQTIYVVPDVNHAHIFDDVAFVDEPIWIAGEPDDFLRDGVFRCQFKYQHVYKAQNCSVERVDLACEPAENYMDGRLHATTASSGLTPEIVLRKQEHLRTINRQVRYKVTLDRPQRAVAPGQYVVFYRGNECLGSAKICTIGRTLYEQNVTDFQAEPVYEMRIT